MKGEKEKLRLLANFNIPYGRKPTDIAKKGERLRVLYEGVDLMVTIKITMTGFFIQG